jgi:hypothetical protein
MLWHPVISSVIYSQWYLSSQHFEESTILTDDAILPHYFTLVLNIYFYLSHFDELSSEDESRGDKMYALYRVGN